MNQKLPNERFKENLSKGADYYYDLLVNNNLIEEVYDEFVLTSVKEYVQSIFDKDGLFTQHFFGKIKAGFGRKTIREEPWSTCLSFVEKTFKKRLFSMEMDYKIINHENGKLLEEIKVELSPDGVTNERLVFKKENYEIENYHINQLVTLKISIDSLQKEIQILPNFKLIESLNEIYNQLNINKQWIKLPNTSEWSSWIFIEPKKFRLIQKLGLIADSNYYFNLDWDIS